MKFTKRFVINVVIICGAVAAGIGIFILVGRLVANAPIPAPDRIIVQSDVPGYSLRIASTTAFNAFLDANNVWDYQKDGTRIRQFKIVYTNAIQPLYQAMDKGSVQSSYGFAYANGILTQTIQIDPASAASTSEIGIGIQQYVLYMVYDWILQAKPDEQTFFMTNLQTPWFTVSK